MVKKPPAVRETWVPSLDQEDPLQKEMATRSSILAWRMPWTEESGRLHTVHGVTEESDMTEQLNNKNKGKDAMIWGREEGGEVRRKGES